MEVTEKSNWWIIGQKLFEFLGSELVKYLNCWVVINDPSEGSLSIIGDVHPNDGQLRETFGGLLVPIRWSTSSWWVSGINSRRVSGTYSVNLIQLMGSRHRPSEGFPVHIWWSKHNWWVSGVNLRRVSQNTIAATPTDELSGIISQDFLLHNRWSNSTDGSSVMNPGEFSGAWSMEYTELMDRLRA